MFDEADGGVGGFSRPDCIFDPVEFQECPDFPSTFEEEPRVPVGSWDAFVRVTRGTATEDSEPIRITIFDSTDPLPGRISLSEVTPNEGSPPFVLREEESSTKAAITTPASRIEIVGENLDNNEFLRFFLAPILVTEQPTTDDSALPANDWCRVEAELEGGQSLPNGASRVTVVMPERRDTFPLDCGDKPGPSVNTFDGRDWRWALLDNFTRPEFVFRWWAIPSQRDVPWSDAPPFKVGKPA